MNDPKIGSREEALRAGENRYFTGKRCIHGHISPRYTLSGNCISCHRNSKGENRDGINHRGKYALYKTDKANPQDEWRDAFREYISE